MAQLAKLVLISLTVFLLIAYSLAVNIIDEMYKVRLADYERKAALYDLKKQQLFKQVTSLQTVKLQLLNQLESELLDSQRRQTILASLDAMPAAPKPSTTVSAGVSQPTVSTTQPPAPVVQPNALLDQLNKIKQVQTKTTSTTPRRQTRAS